MWVNPCPSYFIICSVVQILIQEQYFVIFSAQLMISIFLLLLKILLYKCTPKVLQKSNYKDNYKLHKL